MLTERMGREGPSIPTITYLGYSSAAELFVITSGLLFGLVYFPKDRRTLTRNSVDRIAKIYLMNGFILSIVVTIALLAGPVLSDPSQISQRGTIVTSTLWSALLTTGGPFLLGILPLYIQVIIIAVAIRIMTKSLKLAVTLSVGLYAISLLMNKAWFNTFHDTGFNPFAWQLLFVIPANAAPILRNWLQIQNRQTIKLCFIITVALAALFALCVVGGELLHIPELARTQRMTDKWHLGPVRAAHAVLMFAVFSFGFMLLQNRIPRIFDFFARIGTCSLETFSVSVVAAYAGSAIWATGSRSTNSYIAICGAAAVGVALFGVLLQAWRLNGRVLRAPSAPIAT